MNWWRNLKGKIRINEPLKEHTTFRIGGPAKFFIEPYDTNDLKFLVNSAKRYKLPILIMGRGSNLLVGDKAIKAIVLQLNSAAFKRVSVKAGLVEIGSGLELCELIKRAKNYGLGGFEFLAGIPGTVGGALVMNAGVRAKYMGDLVEKVSVMDYNGKIKVLTKGKIKFGYRKSGLEKYIILSVWLRFIKKNKAEIRENIKRYLAYRRNTLDNSLPSAGCIFKNPSRESAGRLIDLCGLKGRRIGDATISQKHANFILNKGNARASDVLRLMNLIRKRVRDKFNINLEPEIKIWC